MRRSIPLLVLLASLPAPVGAAGPWPARRRHGEELRPGVHEVKDVGRWPAEPASPAAPIDAGRFRAALVGMCEGTVTARAGRRIADEILAAAAEAGVDPFLLGGLVYRNSRCVAKQSTSFGVGLLQLQPRMYAANVRGPTLRYQVLQGDAWVEKTRPLPRGGLHPALLRDSAHNLRVGAALLGMWQDQHPDIDGAFSDSVPHRSEVAHFGWGDIVRGTAGEDRALVARRRLVERYLGTKPVPHQGPLGFPVVSPLEGTPRLAPSGPGEDRDAGERAHRGLDLDAMTGEPVRSIADGEVWFTGYDLPGRVKPQVVPFEELAEKPRPELGPGGLFVCIRHVPGIFSCYMHLSTYSVHVRDKLKAGDVIGAVGRSGIKSSGAHLHLEIHVNGAAIDPAPVLGPELVIPPRDTLARDVAMKAQKHRLRMERRVRRRARQAERAAAAQVSEP